MKLLNYLYITAAIVLSAKECSGMRIWPRDRLNVRSSNITGQLEYLRAMYQVPALGIAVGPKFRGAVIGTRKAGTKVNATIEDIFHIGSDAKAMTATVIAMLIEEGKLSWDTSLIDVLKDIEMLDVYQNVTVEHLTSHRSGITDTASGSATSLLPLYALSAPAGRRQMAERTLLASPDSSAGEFMYANMNYVLAGLIIDIITTQSAEEVINQKLFQPLSMHTAGWGPTPERSIKSIDNPWPHISSSKGPQPVGEGEENRYRDLPAAIHTAGVVHMTLEDWNKFLTVHLDGSSGTGSTALNLSTSAFKKLHASFPGTVPEQPGLGYTYGGWLRQNGTENSTTFSLMHCGSNDFNYACVIVDTASQTIVASVANIGGAAGQSATQAVLAGLQNGTMSF